MRRLIATAVLAAASGLAAYGSASAQVVVEPSADVYVGPYDTDAYYYGGYGYGPRVYGYSTRTNPAPGAVREPRFRNGCGTYFFWNGERCVDARFR